MINQKKLIKNFDSYKSNDLIDFICDYCGDEFKRKKKSFAKSIKIINKDCCYKKVCIAKKREESCLLKYGTKCSLQAEDIKEKTKNTCLKKYNSQYSSQSEIVKEKIKKTNVEKYGVENVFSLPEVQNLSKKTRLKKYGCEHALQNKKSQEKRKKTLLEKYGCEHALQSSVLQEKKKNSILQKYGCEHALQNEDLKNNFFETNLEKYGVKYPVELPEIQEKIKQTCLKKYGVENPVLLPEVQEKIRQTNIDKYGSPFPVKKYGKAQQEIQDWLNFLNFNFKSDYKILNGKELDLYDSNMNFAIEYCGLHWHHENSPQPRLKNYHFDKWKKCKEKNINLITIFEDEWLEKKEIVKSIILSKLGKFEKRIYARNCFVKEIEKKEFVCFCDKYHIQGGNSLAKICFGLFYNNELIGVVDLGNHHRKKLKSEIVLTRLCFKQGCQIIGGASKLFAACINWCKKNKINKIISWSDNRWSNGLIYKKLKFESIQELKPDYFYVQIKNPKERISKQSQKKSNTGCPKNVSEKEFALQNGLSKIWDCGKIRWEFLIKNL